MPKSRDGSVRVIGTGIHTHSGEHLNPHLHILFFDADVDEHDGSDSEMNQELVILSCPSLEYQRS